jgi:hypothetical protein
MMAPPQQIAKCRPGDLAQDIDQTMKHNMAERSRAGSRKEPDRPKGQTAHVLIVPCGIISRSIR